MNRFYSISEEYTRWLRAVTRYQLAEALFNQTANTKRLQDRQAAISNLREVASCLLDSEDASKIHADISRCGLSKLIYTKANHAKR